MYRTPPNTKMGTRGSDNVTPVNMEQDIANAGSASGASIGDPMAGIKHFMEDKFSEMMGMSKSIMKSLDSLTGKVNVLEAGLNETKASVEKLNSEHLKQAEDLSSVKSDLEYVMRMQESLNETQERMKRVCNVLVHGVIEDDKESQTLKEVLHEVYGLTLPKYTFHRLGRPFHGKVRPIKVRFSNTNDVDRVVMNNERLKKTIHLSKIYITRDKTLQQRREAKQRRENEHTTTNSQSSHHFQQNQQQNYGRYQQQSQYPPLPNAQNMHHSQPQTNTQQQMQIQPVPTQSQLDTLIQSQVDFHIPQHPQTHTNSQIQQHSQNHQQTPVNMNKPGNTPKRPRENDNNSDAWFTPGPMKKLYGNNSHAPTNIDSPDITMIGKN